MSRFRQIAAATIIAAAGATALIGQSASAATTESASLKVASVKVGSSKHMVLLTASGRPAYLLTGDSMSHPTCTSATCLKAWPPVTTTSATPALGKGIKGKLTVWKHGHFKQLVLNGHPLYTFVEDKGASTASGQGLKSDGGVWETLTTNGAGLSSTASKSTTKSSSSGSSSAGGGWA
jgi:predicted lipoprotein with Yx(FWY)xxD motif